MRLMFIVISLLLVLLSCNYNPTTIKDDPNTVTDIDGNVYTTVKLGNQVWTVENLRTTKYNDGTAIPLVTDSAAWSALATPGYCYYNNTTNADSIKKFGALYNWYVTGTKKLAPTGWHVSSDTEWIVLEEYLIANGYNYDGTTTGDKIAKSLAAQTDWYTDSTPGAVGNDLTKNNKSGFSAYPAGGRFANGDFRNIGVESNWWHATEKDASFAFYRLIRYEGEYIYRSMNLKKCGFPVRLVKD